MSAQPRLVDFSGSLVSPRNHAEGAPSIATGIAWDALERAKEWVAGNGVHAARNFEQDTLRLGGLQVLAPSGTPVLDLQYAYRSDDRVEAILD